MSRLYEAAKNPIILELCIKTIQKSLCTFNVINNVYMHVHVQYQHQSFSHPQCHVFGV